MITEQQVTGAVARDLREKAGLPQRSFWEPLGVHQSRGCQYESGASSIPKPVRILLVARYVTGLHIDASTPDGVAKISRLSSIQANHAEAKASAKAMRSTFHQAAQRLQSIADALQSI